MNSWLYNFLFAAVFMAAGATIAKFVTWRRVRIERLRAFQDGQRNMLKNVGPYCRICNSNHFTDDDPWRACNHQAAVYQAAGAVAYEAGWSWQWAQQVDDYEPTEIHTEIIDIAILERPSPPTKALADFSTQSDTETLSSPIATSSPDGYDPDDDGLDTDHDDPYPSWSSDDSGADDPDAWIYDNLSPEEEPFWKDRDLADRTFTKPMSRVLNVAQVPEVAWNDSGPILVYPVAELSVPDFPPTQWMLERMREHEERMNAIKVDSMAWSIGVPERTDAEAGLILARELVAA